MSRTPDEKRRAELLERIVDYVYAHGVSQLSLRPLGQAVGCSPRLLLYFFSSKEDLITEVLAAAGARQRVLVDRLRIEHAATPSEICREIWNAISDPKSESVFRLFFEIYGLALQDRKRYASFLKRVVTDWLLFIAQPLLQSGIPQEEAQAYSTVILAGFRGFLLDLCATRDRKRIDYAVDIWLATLERATQKEQAS
ncbi:MAG TPA: TetR/AcrR family transcriptional regulator [Candidatus Baltobacteraceae bacterium]|nr:TetR/AcrR family transcriptional regulator [Candidatus Baltobacteraceae bacterium]